jgi:hypothetical protein
VNLTNGLEAIPCLASLGLPYQFCRWAPLLQQVLYVQAVLGLSNIMKAPMAHRSEIFIQIHIEL